jgi:hypothetical protein
MLNGSKAKWSKKHEMITAPHVSKLKGYVHTNKAKENPNAKLRRGPKLKPNLRSKAKKKKAK